MPLPTPWNAALEPPDDPHSTLPSGTERKMRRRPTDVEYVDLESQKERDNPLVHSFEKVHTATEYQSGRKQLDGSDQLAEQEEALDELELTKLTRTTETAQSIYRADLQTGPSHGRPGRRAGIDEGAPLPPNGTSNVASTARIGAPSTSMSPHRALPIRP